MKSRSLLFRCCSLIAAIGLCFINAMPADAEGSDAAMARIKADGEVVIGYRQSSIPFSYLDASQKPIG